jgi:PfaD family protein
MANGITSVAMVEAMARAGMMGFFGAAGLDLQKIEQAIDALQSNLNNLPFGVNLIHSPNDPAHESAVVDLFLKKQIRRISASAYLDLSLPLVYYRVSGLRRDPRTGGAACDHHVFAKVSRVEVAEKFFSPPPKKLIDRLMQQGLITAEQADLSASIPMATALTAEADSGGHTDNRPAISLLPTMMALRDEIVRRHGYKQPIWVGLAGGISTPASTAAAFAMGAAYVVTGSVNQACVEAGTSDAVRRMLAETRQADVIMAPSADMFEMGVKVQVLKRGTLFALRAARLYELYTRHERYEDIPESQRRILERDFFRKSFEEEWEQTRMFFARRDPRQIDLGEKDSKHKMALVFRSYLGQSSMWAILGDPSRRMDYQIWCGPALGAFNQWVKGSFLEDPDHRDVTTVAMNLLVGACVAARAGWIRSQGVALPESAGRFAPMTLAEIKLLLENHKDDR